MRFGFPYSLVFSLLIHALLFALLLRWSPGLEWPGSEAGEGISFFDMRGSGEGEKPPVPLTPAVRLSSRSKPLSLKGIGGKSEKSPVLSPPSTGGDQGEGEQNQTGSGGQVGGGEETASGEGNPILSEIRARLERVKRYPQMAMRRGIEGRVQLGFSISDAGLPLDLRILQSSGSPLLDEAALQTVARAAPFPLYAKPIEVPLKFEIRQ